MIAAADQVAHPGWYIALTSALALVPVILGTTTSYLKISMALGVLRNGFGAQQVPSNMIVMILSLVLSIFIMQPVAEQTVQRLSSFPEINPARISLAELYAPCAEILAPWKEFLTVHAGAREIAVLTQLGSGGEGSPEELDALDRSNAVAVRILIPAFVLTELKEGLMIGFVLLLPFLVIDLAVANILAGLGMYMMSPTTISLPLKLLLFVSVDGWLLISRGLIASYGAAV